MAEQQERDRRDKPVEAEADKDIKQGGIAGAKRDVTGTPDRAPPPRRKPSQSPEG
jgi:hypothetical protein